MSQRYGWALLLLWGSILMIGILLYGQRQLSEFDPKGALMNLASAPGFDASIVDTLKNNGIEAGSIVHIGTNKDCFCENLSQPHQTQLLNVLSDKGYSASRIAIENAPKLATIFSSLPALVIVDPQFNLRYLGPYATGYGCFSGKNLVESISQYATNTTYVGAIINSDANGCFCHT